MFNGFSPQIFTFMEGLHRNNSRDWFNEHRDVYEEIVKPTVRELVTALSPFIHILNPGLETSPKFNKTIGRLHNDTRFHKNKPPFKKYIFITFPPEGRRWSDAPFLYLAIHRSGVWIGYWSGPQAVFDAEDWKKRIRVNASLFREFLDRNRIQEKYGFMADSDEDGPGKLVPIPPAFEIWQNLEDISTGTFYPAGNNNLRDEKFIEAAAAVLFDLYPFYIFQTSAAVEAEFLDYLDKKENFRFVD